MRKLAFVIISMLICSGGFYGKLAACDPSIMQEEWFIEAKNTCKAALPEVKPQLEAFLEDSKILSNFHVFESQKNYAEMMRCLDARDRMLALEPAAQKNLKIVADSLQEVVRKATSFTWTHGQVICFFGVEEEYNKLKPNILSFYDAAEALNTQFPNYRPSEEEIKRRKDIPSLLRKFHPTEGEVVLKEAKETLKPLLPQLRTNVEEWEKARSLAYGKCEEYLEKKNYQELAKIIEAEVELEPLVQEQFDTLRQTYLTVREKFPKLTIDKLTDWAEVGSDFQEIKVNLGIFLHVAYKRNYSIPVKDEAQVDITKDDLFIEVRKVCHAVLPQLEENLKIWLNEHKAHLGVAREERKKILQNLPIVPPTKKLYRILFNNLLVANESYLRLLEDDINRLLGIKERYDRISTPLGAFLHYSE